MSNQKPIRVMFVCAGNICRSPMAEAVFAHLLDESGLSDHFEIASSGTGAWHVGERPHRGTQEVLRKHGVPLRSNKFAQQLSKRDLETYDYIIPMDQENIDNIMYMHQPTNTAKIRRLLEYAPPGNPLDVVDPYYNGGFDYVYDIVTAGNQGLLEHIRKREGL